MISGKYLAELNKYRTSRCIPVRAPAARARARATAARLESAERREKRYPNSQFGRTNRQRLRRGPHRSLLSLFPALACRVTRRARYAASGQGHAPLVCVAAAKGRVRTGTHLGVPAAPRSARVRPRPARRPPAAHCVLPVSTSEFFIFQLFF